MPGPSPGTTRIIVNEAQTDVTQLHLVLASASPRRQQLLDQIGVRCRVVPAAIDESTRPGEMAADYVDRIAEEKARWVVATHRLDLPVLAADTAVVVDGDILGKPADLAMAGAMLGKLSGKVHEVLSAIALVLPSGSILRALSVSRVTFAPLSAAWIESYCASGEPLDKAGAYAIQGLAAQRISRIEGSYSGVMGLPLCETAELLTEAGVHDFLL